MFFVQLTFAENKHLAGQYMAEHNLWLDGGYDKGWVLLSGSLTSGNGGAILIDSGVSLEQLKNWLDSDPFIREEVVSSNIVEWVNKRCAPQLESLFGAGI